MSCRPVEGPITDKIGELLKCDYKKVREVTAYDVTYIVGDKTLQALRKQECEVRKGTLAIFLYNSLFEYLANFQNQMEKVQKKNTY